MSDITKSVIRNYISVEISNFWQSFLEGWAIFDLFDSHWPPGCGFTKINATTKFPIQDYIYINFQLIVIILLFKPFLRK